MKTIYQLINQIKEEKAILFDLMEQFNNQHPYDNRPLLDQLIYPRSSKDELAHAINAQKLIIQSIQEEIDEYNSKH